MNRKGKACMNGRTLLLTVGAITAILLLVPVMTMAQTIWIYGYVKVGSNYTNGVTVTLSSLSPPINMINYTYPNNSRNGYYQFLIDNGSTGKSFTVTASYYDTTYPWAFILPQNPYQVTDISIPATALSPSPTVTPTSTPRPSVLTGGMVTDVSQTSFEPASVNLVPTPLPVWTPTAAPSLYPTITPVTTPSPVHSTGLFSNISLWLICTVIAIIVMVVAAVAVLLYIRRY